MDVAISGASGLIGTALCAELERRGDRVLRLVRPGAASGSGGLRWDPEAGTIDAAGLEGIVRRVHLAGVPWGSSVDRCVQGGDLHSRVAGTGLIARTVAGSAAATDGVRERVGVGYYGDRGDEVITEPSGPGRASRRRCVVAWEGAAVPSNAGRSPRHPSSANVMTTRGGVCRTCSSRSVWARREVRQRVTVVPVGLAPDEVGASSTRSRTRGRGAGQRVRTA